MNIMYVKTPLRLWLACVQVHNHGTDLLVVRVMVKVKCSDFSRSLKIRARHGISECEKCTG